MDQNVAQFMYLAGVINNKHCPLPVLLPIPSPSGFILSFTVFAHKDPSKN